ncbi:hypothetical protein EOPP23_08040 [Endozoicomonas sp. OPT23]|uniref:hypothetical protein n=1 Tax=Endozoicomonas sp. OPT23 TaxID=2072845 RepID=UPI00129C0F39|nr:hypothetical protein [Endozoicomonas sp. OPT23]MRI32933.1 hypothetical protein [Endozoicomonas sp. OPT23]
MKTDWLKYIVALSALTVSLASQADLSDKNKVIVLYESNSEAHVVLTSRENPGQVIASGTASPVHVSYTCKGRDVSMTSLEGMGHPGTIENTDSEGVLFAVALDQLKKSIACSARKHDSVEPVTLSGFYIGIAGYEYYADKERVYPLSTEVVTKETFIWHDYTNILSQRGFELSGSAARKMEGEHKALADAVRLKAMSDSILNNADFLQLTTYAIGYMIRDGVLVEGSNTELYKNRVPQGGEFTLGKEFQNRYLKYLAFNVTAQDLKLPELKVLDLAPIVRLYAQIVMGALLNNPQVGYPVPGLPTRRFNHYFSRLYTSNEMIEKAGYDPKVSRPSIMVSEAGYTVTQALDPSMTQKPDDMDQQIWESGIKELSAMAVSTIEDPIVELAQKLAEKRESKKLKEAPLILIGELDLNALASIRDSLKRRLGELWNTVIIVTPAEFKAGIAAAGVARLTFSKDEL